MVPLDQSAAEGAATYLLGTECLAVRVNVCHSQLHESCEQLLDQSGRRSHCPHIVYVALNNMFFRHALKTGKNYSADFDTVTIELCGAGNC